jgi:hypothetical protein
MLQALRGFKWRPFVSGFTILFRASLGKCGSSFEFNDSLLQRGAGDLPYPGSLEIPQETLAGGFRREAASANIGQAVAVGVGTIRMRMPSEIRSETIRRGEARPFADKDETEVGSETESNRIADRDPALLHQSKWSDSPPCAEKVREKVGEQRNRIALDGQSGKSVGYDDSEVVACGLKLSNRVGVEGSAENRLAKISSTVRGVGSELQDRDGSLTEDGQFGLETLREGRKVKWSVYCIACLSVGELKIQHFSRGDAMAGSGQRDSSGSEVANVKTAGWNERGHGIAQFSADSCICVGSESRPGMSLLSHASNSGAGRRPRVERR